MATMLGVLSLDLLHLGRVLFCALFIISERLLFYLDKAIKSPQGKE